MQQLSSRQEQRHSVLPRRAKVDGAFGVLQETDAPIIDLRDADVLLKQLVAVVQGADSKRGVDISAFWINSGYEIVVIITALSRPQLQAIANAIEYKMRKELRIKRMHWEKWAGSSVRQQAATGWACLQYRRLTVHVMTPVQRSYYDIEGTWRDDNQDYEKIPVDEMLREDGFGSMRLARELGAPKQSLDHEVTQEAEGIPLDEDLEEERDYGPYGEPTVEPMDYDKDEEDPFWS
jgi:ribosome-associated protein